GELLVDEHTNSYNSPFKYNGKELDEETGNYFYGARYYDPKLSIFLSVDPLAEQAPDWTPYRYGFNNPIKYTDPTGMYENDDPPTGFPREHGVSHSDSTGDWIYDKPSDTWEGQNGSPDIANSIMLDAVEITNQGENIGHSENKSTSTNKKGYFESYFKDYFSYKRPSHANAYSPYIPTDRDIAGGLQSVGNGLTYAGYALTFTGVFAEVGIPLAAIGNGTSTIGFGFDIYLDYQEGNTELAKFKA